MFTESICSAFLRVLILADVEQMLLMNLVACVLCAINCSPHDHKAAFPPLPSQPSGRGLNAVLLSPMAVIRDNLFGFFFSANLLHYSTCIITLLTHTHTHSLQIGRFLRHPGKPVILAMSRPDAKKNVTALVRAYGSSRVLRDLANLVLILVSV